MSKRSALVVLLGMAACGDNRHGNLPPVEVSNQRAITVAMPEDGEIVVDASAVDPEGAQLTYSASAPAHGAITGTAPLYTYIPAQDYSGPDSFTITISDGENTIEVPVIVTVTGVDDAPAAQDATLSTPADVPLAVALEAADIDSPDLSYTIVAMPLHGTLSGDAPDLTYTPAAGYHGTDSFTFEASDGALSSNVATVSILVTICGHLNLCVD